MSAAPLTHSASLLTAFSWHLGRLLSFRHDGRGLPALGSGVVLVLVVLKLGLGFLVQTRLLPDLVVSTMMLKSLGVMGLLYLNAKYSDQAHSFSGYLLLWLGLDGGLLLLSLITDIPRAFVSFGYFWGLLAYLTLLFRARDLKK